MTYPTDPQDTPTTAYKADGTEILDAEKNLFITDLGGALQSALNTVEDEAPKKADAEQITGAWTFEAYPEIEEGVGNPSGFDFVYHDWVETRISAEITANAVKLSGAQTVADVKTFTSSPIVPTPTTANQATNKSWVEARNEVLTKVVNIGTWDMDTTDEKTVSLGVDNANIRSISVIIVGDTGGVYSLVGKQYLDADGGYWYNLSSDFKLHRIASGFFDSASFDDGVINRGYVTVSYVE